MTSKGRAYIQAESSKFSTCSTESGGNYAAQAHHWWGTDQLNGSRDIPMKTQVLDCDYLLLICYSFNYFAPALESKKNMSKASR